MDKFDHSVEEKIVNNLGTGMHWEREERERNYKQQQCMRGRVTE